jgi:hypothetical protein
MAIAALRLMWAAAFGLALWHSGDSVVLGRRIGRNVTPRAVDHRLGKPPRTES